MKTDTPDYQTRILIAHCKTLQNHIVQCLNDSDNSFYYEEMMGAFKMLNPELTSWVLQTTIEQWKSDADLDDYQLNFE
jgi:hypothetical protein